MYEIEITTTTNMPLSYEITTEDDDEFYIKTEELFKDEHDTVYRKIKLETEANDLIMLQEEDTTHTFVLKVTFPQEYSNNLQYADLMEDIKIDLTAKQVI